jgi:Protein of unknown function (DUF2809)
MFRFNKIYFIISVGFLFIEILIGVYMHDQIIRPYGGDFLIVIMLYCMGRAFLNLRVILVAFSVLLFSYFIEWTQYLKLANWLHLPRHSLGRILIGDYFAWTDIICYTLGILTVLIIERIINQKSEFVLDNSSR